MIHVDHVIIGAGPAGTTCAYQLAKKGKECLIIEKTEFPREKLCGGGLTGKAHILLEELHPNLEYDYYAVKELEIYKNGKLLSTFPLSHEIRNVERKKFDNILLQEYLKVGGKILYGRVTRIEERERKIFLTLNDGQIVSCKKLIGADGANSVVRKYLQPNYFKGIVCYEKKTEQRLTKEIRVIFDKRFANGYMYLFPNNAGTIVGYAHKNGSAKEFSRLMQEYNIPDTEKIKGAFIPMFGRFNYPFRHNILLIGDAGGYADSMTGEGLYYALKTGANAAKAIIDGKDFEEINESIIEEIRTVKRMSQTFYFAPVNNLFLWMSTKEGLNKKMSRAIDLFLTRK